MNNKKLLLLGCIAMTCRLASAAAPPAAEPRWLLDANGCKFLSPMPRDMQVSVTITWTGQCVDGMVSGKGEVRAGSWFAFYGEFAQGRIVKGAAEMNGAMYEGGFLDNKRHGPGETRTPDGLITKGTYDRNVIDPQAVEYIWTDGTRYRGEIDPRTQNMQGKGVLEYAGGGVYEGEFKRDQPEGEGILKFPDGEERRGTFVAGQLHGKGSILYANQTRYEGQLRAGEPSGQGRMEFSDGQLYEGAFVSGKYQGKGKLKYSTGGQYEGDFLAGDASGTGTMIFADGRRYQGQFLLGKMHGAGRLTHDTGETYEGEWKRGELTGKCRIVIQESVYDGQCLDSVANGTGHLQDKSKGLDYEGTFKSGVLIRGTIALQDGRTFEMDAEKGEVIEVQKDGSKQPVDQLPADIRI